MATPAAGYSGRSLIAKLDLAKLDLKDGVKAIAIAPPANYAGLTDNAAITPRKSAPAAGSFDFIHFFVSKKAALARDLPKLGTRLAQAGMLWVSWPKKPRSFSSISRKTASAASASPWALST